mgnify:FL=1
MTWEELTELLNVYYNGSFLQMACDYILSVGMTPHEVKEMLAAISLARSRMYRKLHGTPGTGQMLDTFIRQL